MMKVIAAALALCVSACGNGFIYEEKLAGPYRLVAVDETEQMLLCRDLGGGCAGDGLGGQTVFAAGANKRYIALAIHPKSDHDKTDYYYLIRSPHEAEDGGRGAILKGPLNQNEFSRAKRNLALPQFQRVFDELK